MLKNLRIGLFVFFVSLSFAAKAQDFAPDNWQPGFHLLAGGGFNSSLYSSEQERIEGGIGLNLKTDLVYFLNSDWAADWGSSVKFNRVDGMLIWDTQFTLGVRRRLPSVWTWNFCDPYVRVFVGKAPTVIFTEGDDLPRGGEVNDTHAQRVQFEGPVYGLTFGNLAKTEKGTIWFSELSFSYQKLERESAINMQGDVPLVVQEGAAAPNSQIYTITFSIGALIF